MNFKGEIKGDDLRKRSSRRGGKLSAKGRMTRSQWIQTLVGDILSRPKPEPKPKREAS